MEIYQILLQNIDMHDLEEADSIFWKHAIFQACIFVVLNKIRKDTNFESCSSDKI